MDRTPSVIEADIGSIRGHIGLSQALLGTVRRPVAEHSRGSLIDHDISHTATTSSS